MAPPPHIVHPASSLKQASSLWWPLIHNLGWNRSISDGPMHYHAALDGKTWLLLTLQTSAPPLYSSESHSDSAPPNPNADATPQGCVLALIYPNSTGWVGFFLMSEAYRGKGLGAALWRSMEDQWKNAGLSFVGLDGVEEQVKTYERRGFVDVGRILVMVCPVDEALLQAASGGEGANVQEIAREIQDVRTVERRDLAALDLAHTGLDRSRYWISSDLMDRDDVFGYAHYSDSKLTGFVIVRSCDSGHRVGPLYAPSSAVATHLLSLVMQHPSVTKSLGSLVAEVFGANEEGRRVFEGLGWKGAGVEYHRMWKDGNVPGEQREDGRGTRGMFAIMDAGCG